MDHDDNHHLAVVTVGKAKGDRLKDNAECTVAGPGAELLGQISAKDELFTKAAGRRESQPYR